MTAREHAMTASRLLTRIEEFEAEMHNLTPDQEILIRTDHGTTPYNASIDWLAKLSVAHSQAAVALAATE